MRTRASRFLGKSSILPTSFILVALAGLSCLVALGAACSSKTPPAPSVPDAGPAAGVDTHVDAFSKKAIFFGGKSENRTADAPASFPATGSYTNITLHIALECPDKKCDAWDRFGTIGVVQKGAGEAGADVVIEIARFITPYGIAAKWDVDVTDLRPLLSGDITLRAFIDTWVGPGSPYGNGWLLTTSFDMVGGLPEKDPIAVAPIWSRRGVVYGDPAKPISGSAPAQTIDLSPLASAGATSYAVRSFITGHGQGNADNCAEFCSRDHTITIESVPHKQKFWRDDCAKNPLNKQLGNWQPSRAGWCPGAIVNAWTLDATDDVAGKTSATFGYDVQSYVNTCRPAAAADDAGTCDGCVFNTGCAFDDGNHTEPQYYVSSLLIGYR